MRKLNPDAGQSALVVEPQRKMLEDMVNDLVAMHSSTLCLDHLGSMKTSQILS